MSNNSTLEKVFLVCNRNAKLLRLVGAAFDAKSGFSQRDKDEKFDNSEKFAEKKVCQISIENVRKIVKCSLNVLRTVLYLKFYSIL